MSIVYGNSNSILNGGAVFSAPETIVVTSTGFILDIEDPSGDALVLSNGSYVLKINWSGRLRPNLRSSCHHGERQLEIVRRQ